VKEFIYPRDRLLTVLTMVLGGYIWLVALYLLFRFGGAKSLGALVSVLLTVAFLSFLVYLFMRSAVVAYFRGHGVEVTENQLPHIHRQFVDCCEHLLRWPAQWLPILGAAFSRARETTCDLHGRACSASREDAARSLAALAAGAKQWKAISLEALGAQAVAPQGFWMSFHELTARLSLDCQARRADAG
jgi:Zn-dependent protease with chaperone function